MLIRLNTFIDFSPKFALINQLLICLFICTVYLLDLAYLNKFLLRY